MNIRFYQRSGLDFRLLDLSEIKQRRNDSIARTFDLACRLTGGRLYSLWCFFER